MKLRLFILTLLIAAFTAANASASLQLRTVMRDGVNTTSRTAKKDCRFVDDSRADDLLLVCSGSRGSATARYDFFLPNDRYGKPAMHVFGDKLCCPSSSIRRRLVRVSKLHYRIVVSVSKPTRFEVQSVSLSYYVET
jgi:hypothetical protein